MQNIAERTFKRHKEMERYSYDYRWKNQYCSSVHTTQPSNIPCSMHQNPNDILYKNRNNIKIHVEPQDSK